ncbi:hypothetical protein M0K80_RS15745 [Providencia rettgeri]|nr:hypothetical protein [Providencia rettgeri]EJD6672298.1 hypothetical protein [Providencia rettgeri]ELR5258796.1 hypothetical protein [Providencia rettgeri]
MSKKITITLKDESSLNTIDNFCRKQNISRSSFISSVLASTSPLLSEIDEYQKLTNELISKFFTPKKTPRTSFGTAPVFCLAEYLTDIWHTHITEKGVLLDAHVYPHTYKSPKVGLREKKSLEETLNGYIDQPRIKKAILIYTDRHVHYKTHQAGGLSNTILIKETEYKNYMFDFNTIIYLPMNDIVIHGLEAAMEKNQIVLNNCYAAFIPIYHTNHQCILIGVIDKNHINHSITKSPNTIIINPL